MAGLPGSWEEPLQRREENESFVANREEFSKVLPEVRADSKKSELDVDIAAVECKIQSASERSAKLIEEVAELQEKLADLAKAQADASAICAGTLEQRLEKKDVLQPLATVGQEDPLPPHAKKALLKELKKAIEGRQCGCLDLVRRLLEDRADPNGRFEYQDTPRMAKVWTSGRSQSSQSSTEILQLEFTGTPLTLAVKENDLELVLLLFEYRADPDSEYSYHSQKRRQVRLHFRMPVACAAIAYKKPRMLKLLHDKKAALEGALCNMSTDNITYEPNGTLLSEACWFGCVICTRFLLRKCRDDLERPVTQDHLGETMTPIHIAAYKGHLEIVELLVKHNAQIPGIPADDQAGRGPPILADAIDEGHVGIVRCLVKSAADIFHGQPGERGIDYIMNTKSTVFMAATASGLAASRRDDVAKNMMPSDLAEFLMTPNCEEIFDAIFRQRTLFVFDESKDRRCHLHNAQIENKGAQINFANGPDYQVLQELFNDRRKCLDDENYKVFLQKLMPGYELKRSHKNRHHKNRQEPIETCQCILAGIQNDFDLVWATAKGPNTAALEHPGAKALIMCFWHKARGWYKRNFIVNLILAVIFGAFAILINNGAPPVWRICLTGIAALLWLWQVFQEVLQLVGFSMLGILQTYLKDPGNYVDAWRLLMTGVSIIMVFRASFFELIDDNVSWQNLLPACVTHVLWSKVLYSQRGFDGIGQYMLPIMEAAHSMWDFLNVMVWPMLGFVNCYYMLGVYPEIYRAFSLVYRMGFLGDFDLEELEDIDPHYQPTEHDPTMMEVVPAVFPHYHWFILVFMVAVTLSFAIIMMNILISFLTERYNRACSNSQQIFMQTRARIAFEHYAVLLAFDFISSRCCCRRTQGVRSYSGREVSATDQPQYLWYCRLKSSKEFGIHDEDNIASLTHETHSLLMHVCQNLDNFKAEFREKMSGIAPSEAYQGGIDREKTYSFHKSLC